MDETGKNAETGEPETGFIEGKGLGKFNCQNCVHMDGGGCDHPVMVKYSKRPKNLRGLPRVGEYDCCKFQRRPGDR